MLDRIVAQIAMALFSWLEKRIERGHVGKDSDVDASRLHLGGRRLREWMLTDRTRRGIKPDPSGTQRKDEGVHPD